MKKIIRIVLCMVALPLSLSAQNVGIGTTSPKARLHIKDSSVLLEAAVTLPAIPGNPTLNGTGNRLMWYADKASFRAGRAIGSDWNKDSTGNYSFSSGVGTKARGHQATAMGNGTNAIEDNSTAMGFNTSATGLTSTAIGGSTKATGRSSTAMGVNTTASGNSSTAMGFNTVASGSSSTTMGSATLASGDRSTAMGSGTTASGIYSTAMGRNTTASGESTTAMGRNTTASGDFSTAIGNYASTNGIEGCLVIGDNSTSNLLNAAVPNSFRARFDGGYRFFTSAATINAESCVLSAGSNAWSTASDYRLKENFELINGESFLYKIASMKLGSWNYISQNSLYQRHYGPMAQDFFTAFGKDSFGTIGSDTTINSADFDGVILIAIQALEKRTQKIKWLDKEASELKTMILQLRKEMDVLSKKSK